MRAIVFGQSGMEKDSYLNELIQEAGKHNKQLELINLGKEMAKNDNLNRNPEIYPTLTVSECELLRRTALKEVNKKVNENPKVDYILNAHAVFRTTRGLVPVSDSDLLKNFEPDIIIVLVGDFHYIHRRLQKSQVFNKLPYKALLEWRDAEIASAKLLSQQIFSRDKINSKNRRFFILSRGHNPNVLYRLLYERYKHLRIYSSFAITNATEEQQKKIYNFKQRLSRKHIVFDPFKIVERNPIVLALTLLENKSLELQDFC